VPRLQEDGATAALWLGRTGEDNQLQLIHLYLMGDLHLVVLQPTLTLPSQENIYSCIYLKLMNSGAQHVLACDQKQFLERYVNFQLL
jgi:hypothetical protein